MMVCHSRCCHWILTVIVITWTASKWCSYGWHHGGGGCCWLFLWLYSSVLSKSFIHHPQHHGPSSIKQVFCHEGAVMRHDIVQSNDNSSFGKRETDWRAKTRRSIPVQYRRQILHIQNTDSRTEGWILLSDEVRTPLMWKRRILKEFLMELCDFDSNFCSGSFLPWLRATGSKVLLVS